MKLVLVGGGGHCVSCLDVIAAAGREVEGVVDRNPAATGTGLPWLGDDEWLESSEAAGFEFLVTVGQVGATHTRAALHARLNALGRVLATVVSPHALVAPDARLGAGTIVMHRAIVGPAALIGANCIINTQALVEHHAVVGDHTHVATGAIVNGSVRIGTGCLIGSGSVLLQGVDIAPGVIVGAGAVVDRSIADHGTWVGIPARRSS